MNENTDYPTAARVIALWLSEFCDETLPYPDMIADAARKAMISLETQRNQTEAIQKNFRRLREHWFNEKLKYRSPEREWTSEKQDEDRASDNARMRAIYDEQTEGIVKGEQLPIAPLCHNDLLNLQGCGTQAGEVQSRLQNLDDSYGK